MSCHAVKASKATSSWLSLLGFVSLAGGLRQTHPQSNQSPSPHLLYAHISSLRLKPLRSACLRSACLSGHSASHSSKWQGMPVC